MQSSKNEPNRLIFLNSAFPFLSPYCHLTLKRDVILESLFLEFVAVTERRNVMTLQRFFTYSLNQIHFQKKFTLILDDTIPPKNLALFLKETERNVENVLFRTMAVLSFLQNCSSYKLMKEELKVQK